MVSSLKNFLVNCLRAGIVVLQCSHKAKITEVENMMLLLASPFMDWLNQYWWIVLIGAVVLVLVLLVIIEGMVRRNKKRGKHEAKTGVIETKDLRVSTPKTVETFDSMGNVQVSVATQDFICKKDKTLKAGTGKDADLKPGKYTVLTGADAVSQFYVKIGGFQRNMKHGDVIILGDGDEITASTTTIILR